MRDLILLTVIGFICFMAAGITGPINSLYVEFLGANYAMIGWLGTVTSLTAIVFSYTWGRASDRAAGRKVFLAGGLAVMPLIHALSAMATSHWHLYPLRFVGAMAQAAYGTASLAMMGDLLDRRARERGYRMGWYRGISSLGFGAVALVSGSIADRFSLRMPFWLAAGFLSIAFVLSLMVRDVPRPAPQSAATNNQAASQAVSSPQSAALPLPPLLMAMFLWSLVTGAVYAVWANYMVGELAYSRAEMSQLWAIASLSEFPLMILAGWLSDRLGRLPMLSLGFVAWTLVFAGYVWAPLMPWIVVIQLVRGFAYSAFTATSMTYATQVRSQSQRGQVSGLYSSAGSIGTVLGSALGGMMTQWMGFRPMILVNAAIILAGAIYLAVAAVQHRGRLSGASQ